MWLGMNVILQLAEPQPRVSTEVLRLSDDSVPRPPDGGLHFSVLVDPQVRAWDRSFEALMAVMEADGRVYLEGDGAFVLCGQEPSGADNRDTLWLGQLPKPLWQTSTAGWRPSHAPPHSPDQSAPVVWRIEGSVVDGTAGVDHVTINGTAPVTVWSHFLGLIQGPSAGKSGSLVAQLHQFGLYVSLDCLQPGGVTDRPESTT
jgi:hypothetical protein